MPREFTEDRPAIAYSHVDHNMDIRDHAVGSRLPKPTTQPAVVGDPDDFHCLMLPEGAPVKLDDYLTTDAPQIGLHVVSFTDATLVSLYWPHTLFDAMGKRALLDAWTLVLQGRDDKVLPLYGVETDPLAEFGKHPTEPYKLAERAMSIPMLIQYGLSHIFEFVGAQETRMVCIPASFMKKLREETLQDLAAQSENGEGLFLTDGDIICAWWLRLATAHLPRSSDRTLVVNNAYQLRNVLEKDLLPPGNAHVFNATGFINVVMTTKDVFEKPTSYIALQFRRAIEELGTREQVESFAAMIRASRYKLPPFFGDRTMHMVTFSNWGKAKLFETDFSAALRDPGLSPQNSSHRPGKPRYIQNCQFGLTLPNAFPIIGKDGNGNYWISGYLNKGQWQKMEQLLAEA